MSSIATANSGGIVVKAAQCIRDNKERFLVSCFGAIFKKNTAIEPLGKAP